MNAAISDILSAPAADPAPAAPRPLKVAVVMPLAEQRGGGELMLLHLLEHGRDLGVRWVVLFLEDGPMVGQARAWGIDARVVEAGRLRQPHRLAAAVWRLARAFRREGVDLVLGWMAKPHLYAGPAAALAGVPAAWYQLGLPGRGSLLDVVATLLPARGVLACSKAGAAAQAALRPRRAGGVVYPGVDLSRFDPDRLPPKAEARRRLELPAGVPIVGIVGRLQRWKGMHLLVEAMPALLAADPETRCVIVGGDHPFEPDYPAFLNDRIRALGVADRVILTGLRRDVPEWMRAMDVVVHASDHEPFGIVVIEAMALGQPVVATDTAGPTEIITPGVDGLLWKTGDSQSLAAAVLRCLRDPAFAERLGAAARRRAADFSTAAYARGVAAWVRGLVGPGPRPDGAAGGTRAE